MSLEAKFYEPNPELKPLLLPLPGDASTEEWSRAFPISEFCKLPSRDSDYYCQPYVSVIFVTMLSLAFINAVTSSNNLYIYLNCTWAAIAVLCTAYIIFGAAGEIKRSPRTCYPIPAEAVAKLRGFDDESSVFCKNIHGEGNQTYCVRSFVWRPHASHHCKICQRCYTGFDHHCDSFYGRCIVNGSMPCFYLVPAMLLAAILTTILAFQHDHPSWAVDTVQGFHP